MAGRGRQTRSVERWLPLGYFVAALALVVAVLPTVLRPPQQPPTQTAELSPDAPPDEEQQSIISSLGRATSGTAGQGEGVGPSDAVGDAGPAGPGPTTGVPRTRRCVGNPPRQIEDPQSPPCVPGFVGDNGGATARGVTANEVRIGIPRWNDNFHPLMEKFFNSRFEFYGRQLRLINLGTRTSGGTPEEGRADAAVANAQSVFATTEYGANPHYHFHTEAARLGIVTVTYRPLLATKHFDRWAPYLWQYTMAADTMFHTLGEWTCARLAGGTADFAGTESAGRPRVFGIIQQDNSAGAADLSTEPLKAALKQCGVEVKVEVIYGATGYHDPQVASNAITQLRSSGVTSVFCLCHIQGGGIVSTVAASQGYQPEWLLSTYLYHDTNWGPKLYWHPDSRAHAFGISATPKQVRPEDRPMRWAVRETDSASAIGSTAQNGDDTFNQRSDYYRTLLLLAAGIQMAGPRLTPETFAAALHRTPFPNPFHPIMAGSVGFAGSSATMTEDVAEIWWSDEALDPYPDAGRGAFCYVDGGKRIRSGQFEKAPPRVFTGTCDSGADPATI